MSTRRPSSAGFSSVNSSGIVVIESYSCRLYDWLTLLLYRDDASCMSVARVKILEETQPDRPVSPPRITKAVTVICAHLPTC